MSDLLQQYFRYPEPFFELEPQCPLSEDAGYFRFGETVCYGRSAVGTRQGRADVPLYDTGQHITLSEDNVRLPFDAREVIDNLRFERYFSGRSGSDRLRDKLLLDVYYAVRPILPLSIRKHLQKIHLRKWRDIPFPSWPVDRTVDLLIHKLLLLEMKARGVEKMPFIWFWPDGARGCSIMTHDVEAEAGRQFCSQLMDINESFGIPASFQIVPERRYHVTQCFVESIKNRGFEVNVQDLDHDGRLFRDRDEFLRRATKINRYGRQFGALGFRSAILYRNQNWYDALDFEYDMTVPNVAHLDPQRGGCCTVMPYFVGKMLELPVTTTQDHSLFNILNDYSLELWKHQIELILEQHGLISFIVHPDYIIDQRPRDTYKSLLQFLVQLGGERNVWMALPGDVNLWWRQRDQMKLILTRGKWEIDGPGKERARVAVATLENGQLIYEVPRAAGCSGGR